MVNSLISPETIKKEFNFDDVILSSQKILNKINSGSDLGDLTIPLVDREITIEKLKGNFVNIVSQNDNGKTNRKSYSIAVLASTPGIGKTRMLHEIKKY